MKTVVERRNEIVELVNTKGKVRVEDLASRFNVSTVTIRNDLSFLEKKGYIIRSHGTAIQNSGLIAELSVHEKRHRNIEIKAILGKAAAGLIEDGDIVILDSGTTTLEIARSLRQVENVVVMTNGLDVAMELSSRSGVEVLMTGGVLRKDSMSFSGPQSEAGIKNHRFDKVFLGVDGFDFKAGLTTYNEQEASLNRLMCELSDHVIAIADSSKFGKHSCHMIRNFDAIDTIITDSGIPNEYLKILKNHNVDVILVDKDA